MIVSITGVYFCREGVIFVLTQRHEDTKIRREAQFKKMSLGSAFDEGLRFSFFVSLCEIIKSAAREV